ncbi:hypothetical protein FQR65_LT16267 [Abscondita terminalis]|nr:hypothetical protein FQR65_LT16267 [Abscondita terminalis]
MKLLFAFYIALITFSCVASTFLWEKQCDCDVHWDDYDYSRYHCRRYPERVRPFQKLMDVFWKKLRSINSKKCYY